MGIANGNEPRPKWATMLNLHCGAEIFNRMLFNSHVKGLKKLYLIYKDLNFKCIYKCLKYLFILASV